MSAGIIDVFAPDWDQPVRIELFDDEIESLRAFDVASQRSLESLEAIDVTVLKPGSGANWASTCSVTVPGARWRFRATVASPCW